MMPFLMNGESMVSVQTPGMARFSGRKSSNKTRVMPRAKSEQSSQNDE
jgi:hypothetical protein